MGSFGSCEFEEVGDGNGSGTSFASTAVGRRVVIPGCAGSIFSRNYAASHTLETQALGSYAEIDALRNKVGDADTLTLANTLGVALLLSVRPARVFLSDCYTASLTFRWAGAIGPGPGLGGYGSIYGNNLDGM